MASSSTRVFARGCRHLMEAVKSSGVASSNVRRRGGIVKAVPVSPVLGKFLGVPEVSRTDAVKKLWDYIKRNNLQNPQNKKQVCCDETLKTIFEGKEIVDFLEIPRLLSTHFRKAG